MGEIKHFLSPRMADNYREVQQVAAAIHRMNNEPGMATNPVWKDLCEYFNRRQPGNCWEAPF